MTKVLILDDCAALRPLYARTVTTALGAVERLEAQDLEQARGLLEQHADVDLVLCDQGLLETWTAGLDPRWVAVGNAPDRLPEGLGGQLPKPFRPAQLLALLARGAA